MMTEWLQYRLTMFDKTADVKDPWTKVQQKGKLKEYQKEFKMLQQYMEGRKPKELSKEFKVEPKKVYKTVELFKAFT